MASHLVEIYDALANQCIRPLQDGMGIKWIDLGDYYRLAPDMKNALNAVLVVPLEPEDGPGDSAHRLRRVAQPFDVFFVWPRSKGGVPTDMRQVIEKYADPLHDVLCAEQVRRLDNLKLHDAKGRAVGHVTAVDVGPVNMDPPDNADLYPHLSCLSIRVEVSYITARDFDTQA